MSEQTFKTNEKVKLSVVIVNHNTKQLLQQCLQSIYDTVDGLNFEIFIIDNASSDGSQDMIRTNFPQVRLIANPEAVGFTRAVNKGLAEATGDHFLICHPDIKYLPDTIQTMVTFLETHSQVGVVGGNLLYPDGRYNTCSISKRSVRRELVEFIYFFIPRSAHKKWPWLIKRLKKAKDSFYWDHQNDTESDMVWNACMMFKREVLETAGAFCEEFFVWFSDADLCYRAKDVGWQIYYLLDAKIVHYEKQSGDYLDNDMEEVKYKVKFNPAAEKKVDKDRYTLLKRHYNLPFLWFRKALDTVRWLWIRNRKWIRLRLLETIP